MKKIILIIIDGLGDRPINELKNKTPLEAAEKPNLNKLASDGICGLLEPYKFPWENVPTSEGAHIGLLGYKNYFLGRGPYEALGIGMELKEGDVALRANFSTVDKNLKIIDRRAQRIDETQQLIDSLNGIIIDGVKFFIKKSFGHRAGLVLRGNNLSSKIFDGDPHKIGVKPNKILAKDKSKSAKFTAEVLNKFLEKAYQILKNHPYNLKREKEGLLSANYLLVRGAGKFKKTPNFKEVFGLKAVCIAGGGLYKGIAKTLGMDLLNVKGATGLYNTNLKGKFLAAKKSLNKYNFVFLHIKAADNLAEDGNFIAKKSFIEKIDKNIKPILGLKNILIIITADHSTPCNLKNHSSDPVPLLIWGNGKNGVTEFSEKECKNGKLGKIKAKIFMKTILKIAKNY